MKRWLIIVLIATGKLSSQSLELRAGRTLIPGAYTGIKYQTRPDYPYTFSVAVFNENSHQNDLRYNSYGVDPGLAIKSFGDRFTYGICLGPSLQYETEPWLYGNWPPGKHINLGAQGELFGELEIAESFSLTAFAQQKYFLNSTLGNFRFNYGLGIQFRFN